MPRAAHGPVLRSIFAFAASVVALLLSASAFAQHTVSVTQVPPTCGSLNGSLTAVVSGGTGPFTYLWSPGGQSTATIGGLPPGIYSVVVTDTANGAQASATSNLGAAGLAALVTVTQNVSCPGGGDGTATASGSGGTPPYTYAWTPSGRTAGAVTGLSAGTYNVAVTDANGCTAYGQANVTEPPPIVNALSVVHANPRGACNGSATSTPSGGTPGYIYFWTPLGGPTATISNLCAFSYTSIVSDAKGCTAASMIVVAQPPAAPAIGTASAGVNSASVAFAAPADNGGTGILDYTATCGTQSATAASSPIVVGGIAAGATVSCTVSARNAAGAGPASAASNAVTAAASAYADLAVTLVPSSASTYSGSDVTYTLTLSNAGPDAAANAVLANAMPSPADFVSWTQSAGPAFTCTTPAVGANGPTTCTTPSLPAGASAVFDLVVHIPSSITGMTAQDAVSVNSATFDPNTSNNAVASYVAVTSLTDIVAAISAPASVAAGANVSYAITISVPGTAPATTDAFSSAWSLALPAGTTFVSLAAAGGATCSTPAVGGTGTVSCGLGQVTAGSTQSFTLTVATAVGFAGSSLAATVTATTTTLQLDTTNDTATATTSLARSADLSVALAAPASATSGTNVTSTLSVANAGPHDAASVSLTLALPAGAAFVSLAQSSGPAFACTTPPAGSGGSVTCTVATLPAGAGASFTLVTTASSNASDTATATIASATSDPVSANNAASATTTLSAVADVSVSVTGPSTVPAGGDATYTVVVTNAGPSSAQSVSLANALSAAAVTSFSQSAGPAFACASLPVVPAPPPACSLATLAAGATAQFTMVVKADAFGGVSTAVADTATVTSATSDPNPGNNSATASTSSVATSFTGPSATGSGNITASFTGGGAACSFATARFIAVSGDAGSPPTAPPAGLQFPHGLFDFTTAGCTPGAALAFTLTYPAVLGAGTQYWKFGPTPADAAPHWYVLPANIVGNTVTFTITDGGLGDDDLAANGAIVDQGGPGGGPVGAPLQVPTLSQWMLVLLAALMGAGAFVHVRGAWRR